RHGPDRARVPGHGVAAGRLDHGAHRGRRGHAAVLHRPARGRPDDRRTRHRYPQRHPVLAFRRDHRAGDGRDDCRLPAGDLRPTMTTRPEKQARTADPAPPRRSAEDRALPESRASLWMLTAGPATWAVHFLLSYVTAAI